MRKLGVRQIVAGIVVGLAICIGVTAYWDYVVIDWVTEIGFQNNALYGYCLSAEMLTFGTFGGALIKLSLPGRKVGNQLAITVFVTCLIFVLGNLEDWLYFIIGFCFFHHPFPTLNTQWNWMFQASTISWWFGLKGSWTTLDQIVWSAAWLFGILPASLTAVFKFPD